MATVTEFRRRGRITTADPARDPLDALLTHTAALATADPSMALRSALEIVRILRLRCVEVTVGLTPAELRIVGLAADGTSNREIAERLFLSVRTVESHLSHAYGKIGIRTKAELAAWYALEHGS
jgi:DNA-binding CsgD family transcriptional regulator